MLRAHEQQLKEAQAVPATLPELEATKAALKVYRHRPAPCREGPETPGPAAGASG